MADVVKIDAALVGIAETIKESGGSWQPCSGCYDTEDGHPTQKYDYSPALQTAVGCGCHECGGLGAVWWHMTDEEVAAFEKHCEEANREHELQTQVTRLEYELRTAQKERDELRVGIKRLSDEEELCGETMSENDAFDLVRLAAKLSESEQSFRSIEAESNQVRELCTKQRNRAEAAEKRIAGAIDAAGKILNRECFLTTTFGDGKPYAKAIFPTSEEAQLFVDGLADLRKWANAQPENGGDHA